MQLTSKPRATADEPALETIRRDPVTFLIASQRGFCYGVERAVRMARETLDRYPEQRVFLTSQILHNPRINAELKAKGVRFLSEAPDSWTGLGVEDVVILPAFGVPPSLRSRVEESGATIVDTTCGSVMYVWKSVDRFVRDGFTVVYHGRRGHEEAEATLSRLSMAGKQHPYVLLEGIEEAEHLARFLEGRLAASALMETLTESIACGLDPHRHLDRIGFANQTTMLARESIEIALCLQRAQATRFPDALVDAHFRLQDTICSATEERQAALEDLLERDVDVVLVVGGYQSSNTAHLTEMALASRRRAYHVEDATSLVSPRLIRHKPPGNSTTIEGRDWLPRSQARNIVVGLTSGASTPDTVLREVLERTVELARSTVQGR